MSVEFVDKSNLQLPLFVGIDVGGTSIKIGLVDDLGRTLGFKSFPTDDHLGPQFAVEKMGEVTGSLAAEYDLTLGDIAAVGLGTPGTMDIPSGMILEPPNMPGWRNFPIRDALSKVLGGKPVAYANDAGAAAFGEYWVGSGRDHQSLVMFTLGTGVGGGIIFGDESLDGAHSHGSECGHVIIDSGPDARICSCGKPGHLEAYASATAVTKRTEEALAAGRESSIRGRVENGEAVTGLMIAEEAEADDPLALEIVQDTADYLSIGIAILVYVVDPSTVILGGAMTFGGDATPLGRNFLARIREKVAASVFPVPAEKVEIDFARLGGDAGYIGAAGLSRVLYQRS